MRRLRKEVWLLIIIFPAIFLLGRLFQYALAPDVVAAAERHQQAFMDDLAKFTPFELVGNIVDSVWLNIQIMLGHEYVSWSQADDVWVFVGQFAPLIYRLPIALILSVGSVIASVWDNQTFLASLLVTISFLIAIVSAFSFSKAADFGDKFGIWGFIPGVGVCYLIGTIICGVLWGVVWLGGTAFGWITDLAGYCMLCGGAVSAGWVFAIEYAGFRTARVAERTLDGVEHQAFPAAAPAARAKDSEMG